MFGVFEVHLVSEHIWSEVSEKGKFGQTDEWICNYLFQHYLVRSLYLKNTATGETRTVTQFHFLSWPAGGVPASSKALLEFRRWARREREACITWLELSNQLQESEQVISGTCFASARSLLERGGPNRMLLPDRYGNQ